MRATQAEPRASSRQLILDAALDAFYRRGYGSTSMSDIRRATGVSTGSLYHHFAGKEHIAAALFADGVGEYQQGFLAAVAPKATAEDGIRAGVAFHMGWVRRNRALAHFLLGMMDADVDAAASAEVTVDSREFVGEVQAWLTQRAQAGEIRTLATDLYYPAWIGPAQEVTRQWLRGRTRTSLAEITEQLSDVAWTAMRA